MNVSETDIPGTLPKGRLLAYVTHHLVLMRVDCYGKAIMHSVYKLDKFNFALQIVTLGRMISFSFVHVGVMGCSINNIKQIKHVPVNKLNVDTD